MVQEAVGRDVEDSGHTGSDDLSSALLAERRGRVHFLLGQGSEVPAELELAELGLEVESELEPQEEQELEQQSERQVGQSWNRSSRKTMYCCSSNKQTDQRRQGEVDGQWLNVMLRGRPENDDATSKSVVLGAHRSPLQAGFGAFPRVWQTEQPVAENCSVCLQWKPRL
jgi:hypothetical protein